MTDAPDSPNGHHQVETELVDLATPQQPERQASLPLPSDDDLPALIEALLLVSPEPTTTAEIAEIAGVSAETIDAALEHMAADETRGWRVVRHGEHLQLATAPRFADHVRRFLGLERETRLTGASLETLAVIAYRQPVTRAEIESVRGVDCSGVLTTLLGRGLIEAVGRLPALGNPIQYGTSPTFLRHFGMTSLDDLPPLGTVGGTDAATLLDTMIAEAEPFPPDPDEPASGDAG